MNLKYLAMVKWGLVIVITVHIYLYKYKPFSTSCNYSFIWFFISATERTGDYGTGRISVEGIIKGHQMLRDERPRNAGREKEKSPLTRKAREIMSCCPASVMAWVCNSSVSLESFNGIFYRRRQSIKAIWYLICLASITVHNYST